MSRTTRTLGTGATLALTATALLAGAGAASADTYTTQPLSPGASTCVSQSANYQVRGDGTATGGGARFKLLRNGVVLDATTGRVTNWADERRTSYGSFPGAGSYSVCAYNTGTTTTTVYLRIRTDGELG